jgi:hypothetical protein
MTWPAPASALLQPHASAIVEQRDHALDQAEVAHFVLVELLFGHVGQFRCSHDLSP